ncbi:MAG: hypothetical protein JXR44_07500 [Thiotrichales bacterium]|nr:hypothetical protein [Thiotrichales bacterium]
MTEIAVSSRAVSSVYSVLPVRLPQTELPTEPSRTIPVLSRMEPASTNSPSFPSVVEPQTSEQSGPKPQQAAQQIEQVLNQLRARDREVRAHEMAHLSVAGPYATGMSFSYQTGPDGKRYAIGGEVGIDTAPVANDPEATVQKARVIQSAALAPAEPSAQDYRVAAAAAQMMAQARIELAEQNRSEPANDERVGEPLAKTAQNSEPSRTENRTNEPTGAFSSAVEAPESSSLLAAADSAMFKSVAQSSALAEERRSFELRLRLQA